MTYTIPHTIHVQIILAPFEDLVPIKRNMQRHFPFRGGQIYH